MSAISRLKLEVKRRIGPSHQAFLVGLYSSSKSGINLIRNAIAKRQNVGRRTHIESTAHFLGWRNIRIGTRCVISSQCWFNVNQRSGDRPSIVIGDHSFIGQRNFFSPAQLIQIGPYALTGVDCRFMGADHVFADPFYPYIATGVTSEGRLIVGANCWLGAGVSVVGEVSIGHGCVIGAGAMVTKSVPPFSLVVGAPARVVKRFDMSKQAWVSAAGFTPAQDSALPNEDDYIELLRSNAPHIRMPIAAAGKSRGDLP